MESPLNEQSPEIVSEDYNSDDFNSIMNIQLESGVNNAVILRAQNKVAARSVKRWKELSFE